MHKGYTVPAVVTGKPVAIGGSRGPQRGHRPRRACSRCCEALKHLGMDLEGRHGGRAGLRQRGLHRRPAAARARAARSSPSATSRGGIYNPEGLDPRKVLRYKEETGSVVGFPGAETISNAELLELPCDILVPGGAGRARSRARNADTHQGQDRGRGRQRPDHPRGRRASCTSAGIFVIPDILANAGGVTVSYFEWVQDLQYLFWDEDEINRRLERIMVRAFHEVLNTCAGAGKWTCALAAYSLAVRRVAEATTSRGLYP